MLIGAGLLMVLGVTMWLLASSSRYRRQAVRRLAADVGDAAPTGGQPVLEQRVARRTRAVALGVLAAGVVLLVVVLAWEPPGEDVAGPWAVLALAVTFGAAALAAVEIWWPTTLEDSATRTARTSVPVLGDYLPRYVVVLTWSLAILSWLALVGVLVLGQTRWFDQAVVLGGPVPVLGLALTVLAILTVLAARRVLNAPQPARDQQELYWQDALRASTLSSLHAALALVAVLALAVVAEVLDAAASAVAVATGQVGPEWTATVMVLAYILVPLVILLAVVFWLSTRGREREHFRHRLWSSGFDAGMHRQAGA